MIVAFMRPDYPNMATKTTTFTTDTHISERKTSAFLLDTHIATRTSTTFSIDAILPVTTTATFSLDTEVASEGIRFLYQVIEERISGIHTITLSKTTDGPPISKAIWIPPSNIQFYLALSYDGTNFSQDIEIMPHTPYRLSGVARAVRITIP